MIIITLGRNDISYTTGREYRVRYHLSRVRVTIVWSLWRHRQSIVTSSAERKASEGDTRMMCEDPRFSVIYGFVMSCKK